MPTWLIDRLREEGAMIKAAPVTFAFVCLLSLLIAFFVVRWVYRERLENAKDLIAFYKDKSSISQFSPERIETLKKDWQHASKTTVKGKHFVNETVPLDGFSYVECEFQNVTFVFNGTAPFDLINNRISGYRFKINDPAVGGFMELLNAAGVLKVPLEETK